jgi:hypothetical protein
MKTAKEIVDQYPLRDVSELVEAACLAYGEQVREACAEKIPSNWLDFLLSGEDAVVSPDTERLLNVLRERIRKLELK